VLIGPLNLCVCVNEERGDGEGVDSPALSDALRYINLTELAQGWLRCVDRCTLACEIEDAGLRDWC
jgi:hypothetical protein